MRNIAIVAALGGLMGISLAEPFEVDEPFVNGPETLTRASSTIVAGSISHGSKSIERYSESGPNGFPLEWTFTGQLEHATVLKGDRLPEPIPFSKNEKSVFVPNNDSILAWQRSYGDLISNGKVVLFFGEGHPAPMIEAVPSGLGEQDLIALVRDIVVIQAITEPEVQAQRWIKYVETAPSDQGRKVALRSLVHSEIKWRQFAPAVTRLLENPPSSRDIRAFTFAIVAFSITQKRWQADAKDAVDQLCSAFAGEMEAKLALQYILSLRVLLRYCDTDRDLGPSLRQKIMNALALRQSKGLASDLDLKEQYRQIRAQYVPDAR